VLPQPGHKAAEGCEASYEPLNVLDVTDLAYLSDGQNLVGVHLDVTLSDDVPQKLASRDSEGGLLWVQLDAKLLEVVECFF
jgi:hypothetical protein